MVKIHWIFLTAAIAGMGIIFLVENKEQKSRAVPRNPMISESTMNNNQKALYHLYTVFIRRGSCESVQVQLAGFGKDKISYKITKLGEDIQKYLCQGIWNSANYGTYNLNENGKKYIEKQNIALQHQEDSLYRSIVKTIVDLYSFERCEFPIRDEQFQWCYLQLFGITSDTLKEHNLDRNAFFQMVKKPSRPPPPPVQ